MSQARLADAIARLEKNKNLRLPLRSRDLLGRLNLRFLWKRQVKWQVEMNDAVVDAVRALRDLTESSQFASQEQFVGELEALRRSDQNMMSGLNQRLYSAIGGLRTELGDLRLQLTDKAEGGDAVQARLSAIEASIAELTSAAHDSRLRHAQVDLFLDRARTAGSNAEPVAEVPDRSAFLEPALAELLDGPVERVRALRALPLRIIAVARENGATGPVFDAAPSRGEWLEVLRTAEIPARAASANPAVQGRCAELGFAVADNDPLRELASTAARSLGAVLAFRYAERLSPQELARFVDLAARAVQPGGVFIVETPDPDKTSAGEFSRDPFARAPLHPSFLRFLAEAAGFRSVEVQRSDAGRYTLLARM
jgi:hypothetical protein